MESASKNNVRLRPKEIVILVTGFLVLLAAFYYAYDRLQNKKTAPQPIQKISTSSAKKAFSCINKPYINEKQGYKLCLENNWSTASSAKNDLVISLKKVQPATYSATLTIEATPKKVQDEINEIKQGLSKAVEGSKVVDGINGKTISGVLNNNQNEKIVILKNFGRTYLVKMVFVGNPTDKEAEAIINSWSFIQNTPDPPWAPSGNLIVDSPWIGDTIGNPVTIEGAAKVPDGTVSLRIRDGEGNILFSTTTSAVSTTQLSNFRKVVSYINPTTQAGAIEVFIIPQKLGTETDKVVIPVKFE